MVRGRGRQAGKAMAHAVNLRLFVSNSLRPVVVQQLFPHRGQAIGLSNQWRASKGRTSQAVRAEHNDAKIRNSVVTRASASGSSFRDASDALSQAPTGKGPEAVTQTGRQADFSPIFVRLT